MLLGDLNGEVDCHLADLTGSLDLSSRSSIRSAYSRLCEVVSVICESVPSWSVELLSLAVPSVEEITRASILKVLVGAFG